MRCDAAMQSGKGGETRAARKSLIHFLFRHQHHLVFARMPLLENFSLLLPIFSTAQQRHLVSMCLARSESNDARRYQKILECFSGPRARRGRRGLDAVVDRRNNMK